MMDSRLISKENPPLPFGLKRIASEATVPFIERDMTYNIIEEHTGTGTIKTAEESLII